jgi:hypothetical protein
MCATDAGEGTGGAGLGDLAAALGLSAGEVALLMAAMGPALAPAVRLRTLSRGGLADLVAALGRAARAARPTGAALVSGKACAEVQAILAAVVGEREHVRALAARAAAETGIGESTVVRVLPSLVAFAIADLAARADGGIGPILKRIPPLGSAACGSPYADLAGVLRRGCGLGPYAAGRLRKVVRAELARAGGFSPRGVLAWYTAFLLRPALGPFSAVLRGLRTRPLTPQPDGGQTPLASPRRS